MHHVVYGRQFCLFTLPEHKQNNNTSMKNHTIPELETSSVPLSNPLTISPVNRSLKPKSRLYPDVKTDLQLLKEKLSPTRRPMGQMSNIYDVSQPARRLSPLRRLGTPKRNPGNQSNEKMFEITLSVDRTSINRKYAYTSMSSPNRKLTHTPQSESRVSKNLSSRLTTGNSSKLKELYSNLKNSTVFKVTDPESNGDSFLGSPISTKEKIKRVQLKDELDEKLPGNNSLLEKLKSVNGPSYLAPTTSSIIKTSPTRSISHDISHTASIGQTREPYKLPKLKSCLKLGPPKSNFSVVDRELPDETKENLDSQSKSVKFSKDIEELNQDNSITKRPSQDQEMTATGNGVAHAKDIRLNLILERQAEILRKLGNVEDKIQTVIVTFKDLQAEHAEIKTDQVKLHTEIQKSVTN